MAEPRPEVEATGVTLSVSAFRTPGPEPRRRIRTHTPPVTSIRTEDPRRLRGAARG